MRVSLFASLASLATNASAKRVFESADFNVTSALIANGVDVSAVPGLAALNTESPTSELCSTACASLKFIFGDNVLTKGSPLYDLFTHEYWSKQAALLGPTCVFKPSTAKDVSTMVLVSRLTQCPFAVKGGGHTPFAGASSIENGITVSMEKMNEVTLSDDKTSVFVGPGNRWGAVYKKLEGHELVVVGGRSSDVGLGLLLGGGISHLSNIYGYACDNVASFEVVTASGVIAKATPAQFPDLYWALRGGGNNFGVVTQFELETVDQGLMWGGTRVYSKSHYPAVIEAFVSMAEDAAYDLNSAQIVSFAMLNGFPVALAQLEYLSPVNEVEPPAILKKYFDIPAIVTSTMNRTMADDSTILTDQMSSGFRHTFWAATFKLNRRFMAWLQSSHARDVASLTRSGALVFQTFTVPAMQQMGKNGGNALGISPDDGPLMHIFLYMTWKDASEDKKLQKAAQNFMKAAKMEAKKQGVYHDFIYLNYASPYQNVIPSYGKENLERLKSISKKYDPTAVFQKLQPGGFKLEDAPYGEKI